MNKSFPFFLVIALMGVLSGTLYVAFSARALWVASSMVAEVRGNVPSQVIADRAIAEQMRLVGREVDSCVVRSAFGHIGILTNKDGFVPYREKMEPYCIESQVLEPLFRQRPEAGIALAAYMNEAGYILPERLRDLRVEDISLAQAEALAMLSGD